jgi:hypothetical protein
MYGIQKISWIYRLPMIEQIALCTVYFRFKKDVDTFGIKIRVPAQGTVPYL